MYYDRSYRRWPHCVSVDIVIRYVEDDVDDSVR